MIVNSYIRSRFGEVGLPLLMLGLIFFTDYLDGKIARSSGTASPGGAVLDLLADFFFMSLSYLVLHSFSIVPLWFICLVVGKFLEFVFTSIYLKRLRKENKVFIFDGPGRLVAAAFYFLPALLYGSHQLSPVVYSFCINKLTYIICFFSLISSAYRIGRCFCPHSSYDVTIGRVLVGTGVATIWPGRSNQSKRVPAKSGTSQRL
ncbi:MAG: CDP-alcohol phosphatidyltransferase family protein [Firmicutes bacterium]|nr:CDP-alcohol phosphatidyltransferase family protein [Bacillota bacterium]